MTKIIRLDKVKEQEILKAIREGKVIIYPTDTIYGIGCDAKNTDSVLKIREMKQRDLEKPFSVIAQSKRWILSNFDVNESYIDKLPGPFTFIIRAKKGKLVSNHVAKDSSTLGVRIPDHPFTRIVQKSNTPFVTTSVNVSGEKPVTEVSRIPNKIAKRVDIIIDAGRLDNKPSTVIDLTGRIAKIISR